MKRTFTHFRRAWYSAEPHVALPDGATDEVVFCHAPDDGHGIIGGECCLRWYPIGNTSTARLEVFDGAFGVLFGMADVLEALAEHNARAITPAAFCALLVDLGFTDATPVTP